MIDATATPDRFARGEFPQPDEKEFISAATAISDTVMQYDDATRASRNPMVKVDVRQMFDKFWKMQNEIPYLLAELENDFQKIFGIPLELDVQKKEAS
jgi:hypothetical protein